ncbi:laminin subunit alpha-3-like [Carassius carassius]|uniref:laminin subunit alpha-3-like n=1 Tax=Carassius carassius TaxID=217509 RepID=UPI00286902DF|nr:laminin subunit alpha-3-like [Carassius carassius]
MDAVLFYMGNENLHFLVTFEGGYIVLQGEKKDTKFFEKSTEKVPLRNSINIKMILNDNRPATITVADSINIFLGNVKGLFEEAYIGGVPTAVREKYNIVLPPLRGCVKNVNVDVAAFFIEEVGIVQGCPDLLLGSREAALKFGSSLSLSPPVNDTDSGTMVSLGFKISQDNVSSLILTGGMNNELLLSLKNGYVEMRDNMEKLTSTYKSETGKWHYVTAYKSGARMQLNVDNTDSADPLSPSTFPELGENVILGDGLFEGCLRNLYIRSLQTQYIPADLSRFSQTGNVSLGFCKEEHLDTTKRRARHTGITFNSNSERSKQGCRIPKSIKNTFHLGFNSQMQFKIDPEILSNRLHFSLNVRTKSSEGLLLHVLGKYGVPLVILYLDKGKVKLFVGADETISSQKINDGDWHNIKFSWNQYNYYLVVDGVPTPAGHSLKGFTHDLQSPVYVGLGTFQMLHKTQEKVPQKSIIGCIKDIRVSKVLLVDPAVSRGVMPCF